MIIDDDDVLPSTVHADELSKLHSKCSVLQLNRKVMAINGVKLSFPSERLLLHSKRLRCASEHQREVATKPTSTIVLQAERKKIIHLRQSNILGKNVSGVKQSTSIYLLSLQLTIDIEHL